MRGGTVARLCAVLALCVIAVVPAAATIVPESPANAHRVPPLDPPIAVSRDETHAVVVAFIIGTDGRVSHARVAQSSGNARLDSAALAGVANWRYHPATRDGRPIATQHAARIVFVLPAKSPAVAPPAGHPARPQFTPDLVLALLIFNAVRLGVPLAFLLVGLVFVLSVYLLPGLIAYYYEHPRTRRIVVTNLLLGWTGIGWLATLVWAFRGNARL